MSPRPSHKEILNKISDALNALRAGKLMFGTKKHLAGDLEDLELDSEHELLPALLVLPQEIETANPINCYAGTRPPQRSYELEIHGLELWPYSWQSTRCGRRMYLKFALKKGWYVYVDCHTDNPKK